MASSCRPDVLPEPQKEEDTLNYLYFEAVEPGATVSLEIVGRLEIPSLEYSTDRSDWTTYDFSKPDTITLENAGDKVYWRNKGKAKSFSSNVYNYVHFVLGKYKVSAGGNLMSLIDKSCSSLSIPSGLCFHYLFRDAYSLVEAPELPATELARSCYVGMFYGCSALQTAPPELPAKNLTDFCYDEMFAGCSSLVKAPKILAENAAIDCCLYMFSECTSLKEAPELPATTMADGCYYYMFLGCKSLTTAPSILPATKLDARCYCSMFAGCTSLVTVPELPATELYESCYSYMFKACTSLEEAPKLPAKKMAMSCYEGMFEKCFSLIKAPELPATDIEVACYEVMFGDCTSLTTAPELPATELKYDCYAAMFYGCKNLNRIKVCFDDWNIDGWGIHSGSCRNWVAEVSPNGYFECPEGLEEKYGLDFIPQGWKTVRVK